MRIAVVGCGAMGSVYAALLGDAGNDVVAVDRWVEHVEAIRTGGLRVHGASGDRTVQIDARTSADGVDPVDLVIVATKSMDAAAAAHAIAPLLHAGTVVLPIQNGLGSVDAVAAAVGPERVIVGVVGGFGASIVGPGEAHHHGMELVRLGERSEPVSARVELIAEVWRGAGFRVQTYDDADRLVWEKLICNVTFSAPCAVLDCTVGQVLDDDDAFAVAAACAEEAFAVARAAGIALSFDDATGYVRRFGEAIPDARPSLLLDLHAGRATEIETINGSIVTRGEVLGVATPVNRALVRIVRVLERTGDRARRHPITYADVAKA